MGLSLDNIDKQTQKLYVQAGFLETRLRNNVTQNVTCYFVVIFYTKYDYFIDRSSPHW